MYCASLLRRYCAVQIRHHVRSHQVMPLSFRLSSRGKLVFLWLFNTDCLINYVFEVMVFCIQGCTRPALGGRMMSGKWSWHLWSKGNSPSTAMLLSKSWKLMVQYCSKDLKPIKWLESASVFLQSIVGIHASVWPKTRTNQQKTAIEIDSNTKLHFSISLKKTIYSCIFSNSFILVRPAVNLEPILGAWDARWEDTAGGMPIYQLLAPRGDLDPV